MKMSRWTLAAVAALAVVGTACEDTTGPEGNGQIQILITDAPADYIETAEVWISRVYLQGGEDEKEEGTEGEEAEGEGDEKGRVDLFNDPENPRYYDLLTLQDGVTEGLTAPVDLEAGTYGQLRLVVDHALVTLKEGYEFRDGTMERELFVPSGMQTGIKVLLDGPIVIADESLTIVTVDFDVNDNFVLQGNPETPAGIQGILFTPVLTEKDRSQEETEG